MKTLFDVIENRKQFYVEDGNTDKFAIPNFITANLKFPLFDWQKSALENFLIFENLKSIKEFPDIKNHPTHLLFNMATGAGKTLMMAALILYYYDKGYRHFLFFVNQNNIVDKTENNFVDASHNKFLFQQKIMHGNRVVPIKKVDVFSNNPQGIEIKFTSIQKLYNDIPVEHENQTTLADLHKLNIVMLGDEAHHLNTQTKKDSQNEELDWEKELTEKSSQKEIERKGWEHMVLELILKKNGKPSQNVLLEFTATLPEHDAIQQKYTDKIIAQFDLKDFLQAGFTKEINLVSSTLAKKERVLHALLFAWYRHQIALKYDIANFKPVMLFRSKTIDESWQDFEWFLRLTQNLTGQDFDFIKDISGSLKNSETQNEQGKSRTEQVMAFMSDRFSGSHVADWIRQNYQAYQVIITNSKSNKNKTKEITDAETDKLLNSLEAADNPIRAIFTVDKLTEGWDVLNLFDIVRLYEGTNPPKSGKNKVPTVAEKQLIGRGVRYYPFAFEDKIPNKRKFDADTQHELRVLEELFYYTHDEQSRYLSLLKAELRKDGFIAENDDKVLQKFAIKPQFAENESFKNWLIWVNEKQANPHKKQNNANSLRAANICMKIAAHSRQSLRETLFVADKTLDKSETLATSGYSQIFRLPEIEKHIFDKALHIKGKSGNSFFHFKNLQDKLGITSRDELQADLLENWQIEFVNLGADKHISPDDKLAGCLKILDKVTVHLNECDTPFIGTEHFTPKKLWDMFGKPKQKWVEKSKIKSEIVQNHDWYVLDNFIGNGLEEDLLQFIAEKIQDLRAKYDVVYLLRNEEVLKLHHFQNGEGFMPDFILLLKNKEKTVSGSVQDFLHYQIFIEPKGEHLLEKDAWKQDFLAQLTQKYGKENWLMQETPHYRLIGLPFFREQDVEHEFAAEFQNLYS
ncbi:MAG: DEAD/DEAH box helicase family protein [Alysiella sp.]|uniref:DEAD/DEAH box helicase family protein n=1 Tax=Alysiella sp. TaxID=1872483 RepID=UPI0026DA9743|nr:DEAD/DEAH box helicase family protein [Alysiella sp.]MDO4433718.1 DEAD/DEAH box helicase family protein [Alysiella sp.]